MSDAPSRVLADRVPLIHFVAGHRRRGLCGYESEEIEDIKVTHDYNRVTCSECSARLKAWRMDYER